MRFLSVSSCCGAHAAIFCSNLIPAAVGAEAKALSSNKDCTVHGADGEGKHAKTSTGGTVLAEALFDRTGSLIFISQARGTMAVLDATTLQHIDIIKVRLTSSLLMLTLRLLDAFRLCPCRLCSRLLDVTTFYCRLL